MNGKNIIHLLLCCTCSCGLLRYTCPNSGDTPGDTHKQKNIPMKEIADEENKRLRRHILPPPPPTNVLNSAKSPFHNRIDHITGNTARLFYSEIPASNLGSKEHE